MQQKRKRKKKRQVPIPGVCVIEVTVATAFFVLIKLKSRLSFSDFLKCLKLKTVELKIPTIPFGIFSKYMLLYISKNSYVNFVFSSVHSV